MKMNHTQQQSRAGPRTNGFTIVELLVVMAIIGIVGSLALYGLRGLSPRAVDAAGQLGGTVKQVRAKAMATTSFYRLVYASERELRAEWTNAEDGCDETDAADMDS
ncbi:MAG: prepilin-type N-terminal cleavage/methylation domain-containing protein [Trueperaceae bacterium]|nr:prepilin-type N-terminal cleavage/methylation domain-containing protein [Trueperaceae bacterium]